MTNKSRYHYSLILMVLFFMITGSHVQTARAKIVDQLVAVVGDQIITSRDLQQALHLQYSQQQFSSLSQESQDEKKHQQLKKLVDDLLLAHLARKKGIEITKEEIDRTIKRVMEQNKMSDADLKKALEQQGMSLENYKAKLTRDLLRTKLINQEIKPHIILTDEEILEYGKKNNLLPDKDAQIALAQILLPKATSETEKYKIQKTVEKIKRRLKKGESFFSLAREFSTGPAASEGGKLGSFKKGELLPEIEAVAFGKLPVNQMSDIIHTKFGNHLIMVLKRNDPETGQTLESLAPEIETRIKNALFNDKVKRELEEMLAKLHQKIPVAYKN